MESAAVLVDRSGTELVLTVLNFFKWGLLWVLVMGLLNSHPSKIGGMRHSEIQRRRFRRCGGVGHPPIISAWKARTKKIAIGSRHVSAATLELDESHTIIETIIAFKHGISVAGCEPVSGPDHRASHAGTILGYATYQELNCATQHLGHFSPRSPIRYGSRNPPVTSDNVQQNCCELFSAR